MFEIFNEHEEKLSIIGLSMSPFRVIVKDYFQICESYYEAIRHSTPRRLKPSTWPGAACTMRAAKF